MMFRQGTSVKVLYQRTGCLLELINRAFGQSVNPIGHHLTGILGIYTLWPPGLTRSSGYMHWQIVRDPRLLHAVNLHGIDSFFARKTDRPMSSTFSC